MTGEDLKKKIGFTTQTFMNQLASGEITTEAAVGWAATTGFAWVEVRDRNLCMDKPFLSRLNRLASASGIKLQYAWDGGNLLEPGDEDIFKMGIENASAFGKGVLSRITIAASRIANIPGKKGYSRSEFAEVCKVIGKYHKLAAEKDVTIVYENSVEPPWGDGETYFGIGEILTANKDIKLAFDPSNFLTKQSVRVLPEWEEAEAFFRKFREQIPYIHIKSTKDNVLQEELILDGDADILNLLRSAAPDTYICIELPTISDLEKSKHYVLKAFEKMMTLA